MIGDFCDKMFLTRDWWQRLVPLDVFYNARGDSQPYRANNGWCRVMNMLYRRVSNAIEDLQELQEREALQKMLPRPYNVAYVASKSRRTRSLDVKTKT